MEHKVIRLLGSFTERETTLDEWAADGWRLITILAEPSMPRDRNMMVEPNQIQTRIVAYLQRSKS